MVSPIAIYRKGGFGDRLLAAQTTAILIDAGINALWHDDSPDMLALCDVPKYNGELPAINWWWHYSPEHYWDGRSFIRKALDNFAADFRTEAIPETRRFVPVHYVDDPAIEGVDVAICSSCGHWSKYREYPWMSAVKQELDRRGIKWVDMSERGIVGNDALNLAKKSRLYLGIDTGMSHYVAGVVRKGLILQSGFSNPALWAPRYGFDFLSVKVECGNCFLSSGCQHGHRCMTTMSPKDVAEQIEQRVKHEQGTCIGDGHQNRTEAYLQKHSRAKA